MGTVGLDRATSAPARSKALRDTGRALGGALIFSLPMLMTMEMWWLGFAMDRLRLALLLVVCLPLLILLSRRIGFETTRAWREDVADALFALGIGMVTSAVALVVFGAIGPGMSVHEIAGKIAIQVAPASIGALLARSQFGSERRGEEDRQESYWGEMFLMAVGALFLGFNVAPTEEMIVISYRMTPWHAVALVLLSLFVMHGFIFAVGFRGGTELTPQTPWWSAFVRFTLPGYMLAMLVSLYILWTFGRTDDTSLEQVITATIVLGFPSSAGAAAARLIL
ncbi:putative integral membrane protein TIGR02587 [Chelatococcus sambhunathii]|uniref:Integral membrane protein TIGR02587 n=1 Tax=Chelatococcus sambhunathii TaxID=363953 RepID=A0ABP2A5P0_9HYPH|nr:MULTISPECIES: TIGR02587 family membrane protein [Chelatococcus]CUA85815.1 putative integral membrane protein TIGR02587 [Chelatococcus sambhunathii]